MLNLMVTMVLGGLWHGAGWGFVLWGTLHGAYLVGERIIGWKRGQRPRLPVWVVFVIVSLTWIPFRATSLSGAAAVFSGLAEPFAGAQLTFAPIAVAIMGLATILIDQTDRRGLVNPLQTSPALVRGLGYGAALVLAALFWPIASTPFIYFQF